jgi:hypothetical protein
METTAVTATPNVVVRKGERKMCLNTEKRLLASSCTSVRKYRSDSHYKGFSSNLILWTFRKSAQRLRISLKSHNIGHYTWRSRYVYTVATSTEYFVARQYCITNPFFVSTATTVLYCGQLRWINSAQETDCCVSIATVVKRTH